MSMVFNVIMVAFILLIAYWWSNQGVFSSILHCVCVIVAGAIALSFWEPVVFWLFLKGGGVDNYAWGLVLGLLFAISLFILRYLSDQLVPFDVPIPPTPSAIGGAVFGFIAGVVTVGMASISCGFVQAPTEVMGYVGWARGQDAKGAPMEFGSMWIPAPQLTEDFYRRLGLGSLSPMGGKSLATHQPALAKEALSLFRDGFQNGDARASIAPKDVTIGAMNFDPNFAATEGSIGAYAIDITVSTGGYDNGEQFVLSCAQTRLSNSDRKPVMVFPTKFRESLGQGESAIFSFEDLGNYVTSPPAEQESKFTLYFPAAEFEGKSRPSLFFVKGLRYQVTPEADPVDFASRYATESDVVVETQDDRRAEGGYLPDLSDFIKVKNSLQPVQLNLNNVESMKVTTNDAGNFLSGGKGVYKKGSSVSFSRSQRISGFYHSDSTEVVMIDVSRGPGAKVDIWGDGSKTFKDLARTLPLEVIDSFGKGFKPVGYVWERGNDVEIRFDPAKPFTKLSELPGQPGSGEHKLQLVFIVPKDTKLTGMRIGKTRIGTCNVTAKNGYSD